jgi:hypothetical protein
MTLRAAAPALKSKTTPRAYADGGAFRSHDEGRLQVSEPLEEPNIEADDYDTAEQRATLDEETVDAPEFGEFGLEVPDADAAEQAAEVPVDEDEDYPG